MVTGPALTVSDATDETETRESRTTETPRPATIDPSLRNSSGVADIWVRIADDGASASDSASALTKLRRERNRTQGPLLAYVRRHDGMAVENRFWVVNSVILRVDLARVDLTSLAGVDGVVELTRRRPASNEAASQSGAVTDSDVASSWAAQSNDTSGTAWQVAATNATRVWSAYDTRGSGTRVAVLDSGVDPRHPTIEVFTTNANDPTYPGGWAEFDADGNRVTGSEPHLAAAHGQATSGLVAAGNATGYDGMGVAPETQLLHALVAERASVIAGIEWALANDADVISISRVVDSRTTRYAPLVRAIWRAEQMGTVVVAAAGNDGPGYVRAPASIYETVSVGATDRSGAVLEESSSNHRALFTGPYNRDRRRTVRYPREWPLAYSKPDVVAPGQDLVVPQGNESVGSFGGTSGAAPLAAGTLALMESAAGREVHPGVLKTALRCSAREPANTASTEPVRYGGGHIDAHAATERVVDGQGVRGQIVAADGTRIAPATVSVSDCSYFTSHGGSYGLSTGAGRQTLTVDAPGYRPKTVAIDVPAGHYVNRTIRLDRTGVVERWNDTYPTDVTADDVGATRATVAGLESVRVDVGANNTVPPSTVTVEIVSDGEPVGELYGHSELPFGEPYQLRAPQTGYVLLRTRIDGAYEGRLELDVTLRGQESVATRHIIARFSTPTTPTATATETPTASPTPSQSATSTPAPSPTATESSSSQASHTPTPTRTPTATPTPTPEPTPTGTPTAQTPTPKPTATGTPTSTDEPTTTPTTTRTRTPTPIPAPEPVPEPVGQRAPESNSEPSVQRATATGTPTRTARTTQTASPPRTARTTQTATERPEPPTTQSPTRTTVAPLSPSGASERTGQSARTGATDRSTPASSSTDGSGPAFTVPLTVFALVATVLLAARRQSR
ncbi:S8 family serine peptidase [Halomicroarcula sp. F13]|uniref:S8 family serine peptidase n=1 Tax=Haloarcula rubra TaxID=2487747 RepID=A0AAW4PTT4_9EURY|nr:S8 family serine peptidase [Halomicroarcula rubra]MBX0324408.1 S8 family serine peptidase [Halomicroarcula rubra]